MRGVDALWFVGGLGCIVLLSSRRALAQRRPVLDGFRSPGSRVACLSIAINGSRDLPQYFLQAAPALALAAGVAAAIGPAAAAGGRALGRRAAGRGRRSGGRATIRSRSSPATSGTTRSTRSAGSTAATHLAKYGGARDVDKYSALDNRDIGAFLAVEDDARTRPSTSSATRRARTSTRNRRSASRFFWSRPVILDFNREDPALRRRRPAGGSRAQPAGVCRPPAARLVADVQDSAPFFLSQPPLADWLRAGYHQVPLDGFSGAGFDGVGAQRADDATRPVRGVADGDRAPRDRPARTVSGGRSAVALHRRRRLARRRGVGPQRAEQGALRRVAPGRVEPGVHRAGLHGARVRVVRGVRRRRPAGAPGQRGRGPAVRDPARARRPRAWPAIARGYGRARCSPPTTST